MKSIAVVDDDYRIRDLICSELIDEGIEPIPCSDGQDLLDLLDKRSVNLILLDIMMPRMDGITCLKHLKDRSNTIPVLMVTALNGSTEIEEAKELGANEIILKPDLFDYLPDLIEKYLDNKTNQ